MHVHERGGRTGDLNMETDYRWVQGSPDDLDVYTACICLQCGLVPLKQMIDY